MAALIETGKTMVELTNQLAAYRTKRDALILVCHDRGYPEGERWRVVLLSL